MDKVRRVAVTGAAGYLGRLLISRLAQDAEPDVLLGLDVCPRPSDWPESAVFVERDITCDIADLLIEHGIEAVAHLAFVLKPDRNAARARSVNVGGTASVLRACVEAGVRRLLYMSSATVYGAHADNDGILSENSPLRPVRGFQYGEAKVDVEAMLAGFRAGHAEVKVCVLRACPVLGVEADNFVARSFSGNVLVGLTGYDPPMQFLHEDDAAEIMRHCLLNGVEGTYNVGGVGTVRWSEMARIAGRRLVRLPAPLLYGATEMSWRLGLQSRSAGCGLDFIRYPWVVSGEKLEREHGWTATHTSREAWESFVSAKGDGR